ncbi:hypothetical protein BT69DRAFT_306290 [Atractiella rhizophila]|nr:hypothetical protein BT69DRAFT_306290 [Atractiella rhizophila]
MHATDATSREALLRQPAVKVVAHAGSLYPFRGIWYFATRPFLWPLLKSRFIPCAILSIIVLVFLFVFTYLPQVAFLWIWNGPAAWVNGTFLVLSEGAAIVSVLFEAFMVDETQVDVFDAVLVNEGYEDLVKTVRKVSPHPPIEAAKSNALRRLGPQEKSAVYGPFNFRQIFEFVLLLPLNLIPFVGVPLFILLTGYRAGPLQHYRYWKFMGIEKHSKPFVDKHRWKYTAWVYTFPFFPSFLADATFNEYADF